MPKATAKPQAPPAAAAKPAPEAIPSAVQKLVADPEVLAHNLARLVEEAGKAASAFLKPREEHGALDYSDEIGDVVRTFAKVGEFWMTDPQRAVQAQTDLWTGYAGLWASTLKRMMGDPGPAAAEPEPRDKRFADPEWSSNRFYDFVKQFYLISTRWAERMVAEAGEVDPHTRHKAEFYLRQIAAALAPSNFVVTSPELMRETISTNAENLVRGMHMLAEDLAAGGGELRIRQSDGRGFELGRNLALTPGKVIHQNEVCQLIQYAPSTGTVLKRPLLMVPPWINKFYILDLNPEKSFIRWAVEQGHTVFLISWVNPDERLAGKSFQHYVTQGIVESLDAIQTITGEHRVNAVGYCVGGTLLSVGMGELANLGDQRIASATLFATQVDFTYAGDLRVFVDEEQIGAVEKKMRETGYLEGRRMASAFNMLRPNDLIWPYIVKNYLMGQEPGAFDLLYWNSDATRMPAANHAFYLRQCYLNNALSQKRMRIGGQTIDLKKVTVPIYNLATREDHIAPPRSVHLGSRFFGGPVEFVVAGSGHIAGVVNPPSRHKYQYWTDGDMAEGTLEGWMATATEHPGSWWPHWQAWIEKLDDTRVPARQPGGGKLKPIEDAPGSYVRVKA